MCIQSRDKNTSQAEEWGILLWVLPPIASTGVHEPLRAFPQQLPLGMIYSPNLSSCPIASFLLHILFCQWPALSSQRLNLGPFDKLIWAFRLMR